jgi:acetyl-CoA carboxylase carboxyltransferase component
MAGQGFDPTFTFSWPTARIGVMEGDSAIQAIYGPELQKLKAAGAVVPEQLEDKIAQTRGDYDTWLDAKYAAARGHCDALIDPKDTRRYLDMALRVACSNERPEHVPVQLLGFQDGWGPLKMTDAPRGLKL